MCLLTRDDARRRPAVTSPSPMAENPERPGPGEQVD